ncbi:MAG: class I SAM-dependent methyltransferase [Rhodospirillales bacterium]
MNLDNLFYAGYGDFKEYAKPALKPKHIRRFDKQVWRPAACAPGMAFLEIGCGTGLFLAYLKAKGAADITGIDQDENLAAHLADGAAAHFTRADVWDYLARPESAGRFDRICMFDVLEHFTLEDAVRLLGAVKAALKPGGRMIVRVPNPASPWGGQYQFADLTHKTAYTPASLRQLALACGLQPVGFHAQNEGSPARLMTEALLHGFLKRVLTAPPEIWTPNFYAVLEARNA